MPLVQLGDIYTALQGFSPRIQFARLASRDRVSGDILEKLSQLHQSWLTRLDTARSSTIAAGDAPFPDAEAVLAAMELIALCEQPHLFPIYPTLRQVEHLISLLQNQEDQQENCERLRVLYHELLSRVVDLERARLPLTSNEEDISVQLKLFACGLDFV